MWAYKSGGSVTGARTAQHVLTQLVQLPGVCGRVASSWAFSAPPLPLSLFQCSPVNTGLIDRHPYVRRTAVMGVLKIYHIDPNIVLAQGEAGELGREGGGAAAAAAVGVRGALSLSLPSVLWACLLAHPPSISPLIL